jgi:hypothetical protein
VTVSLRRALSLAGSASRSGSPHRLPRPGRLLPRAQPRPHQRTSASHPLNRTTGLRVSEDLGGEALEVPEGSTPPPAPMCAAFGYVNNSKRSAHEPVSRLDLFRGGYERIEAGGSPCQPYGRMRPPVSLSRRWTGVSPSTTSDRGANSACSSCPASCTAPRARGGRQPRRSTTAKLASLCSLIRRKKGPGAFEAPGPSSVFFRF